jgi:tetratricopeptide (TPR) repeat protein
MRLRVRYLALVAVAAGSMLLAAAPARAQEVLRIEGSVVAKGEDGAEKPVQGATVDVYRTDIKESKPKTTTTDKNGRFVFLLDLRAKVTFIVSAPGLAPTYQTDVPVARVDKAMKFQLVPGNGNRPTIAEIGTSSAPKNAPTMSESDRKKAEEERKKLEEEVEKQKAAKGIFDEKKLHFDAGIAASSSKDFKTAVAELTAATEGLEDADPQFFNELIEKSSGNLAEAHYQVAVDAYNGKDRDTAKANLEKGAKAIARAIAINPADIVYYQIQGKILFLLVDKFNAPDKVDAAVVSYTKVAELELDPTKKREAQIKVGDSYRAAFLVPQAIDAYQKVLADDPNNVSAYYGIGLAAMGSTDPKDYQVAADYLKVFLDKAPTDPRAKDVKDLLATLQTQFKIKPRPIK